VSAPSFSEALGIAEPAVHVLTRIALQGRSGTSASSPSASTKCVRGRFAAAGPRWTPLTPSTAISARGFIRAEVMKCHELLAAGPNGVRATQPRVVLEGDSEAAPEGQGLHRPKTADNRPHPPQRVGHRGIRQIRGLGVGMITTGHSGRHDRGLDRALEEQPAVALADEAVRSSNRKADPMEIGVRTGQKCRTSAVSRDGRGPVRGPVADSARAANRRVSAGAAKRARFQARARAAPRGPSMRHDVDARILKMWSRSTAWSVVSPEKPPGPARGFGQARQTHVVNRQPPPRRQDDGSLNHVLELAILPGQ
jgi:hypothetical protein